MKYFIISDVHGFCNLMLQALDKAGFDRDNPEHFLISCGDHFDRGDEPREVIEYLFGLPRKALIRGNHEDLLEECCCRGYPLGRDKANGTAETIDILTEEYSAEVFQRTGAYPNREERYRECLDMIEPFLREMVDYYETKNYVFTHAWIPVIIGETPRKNKYYIPRKRYEPDPEWRTADPEAWNQARWMNPFEMAERGLQPDKTIVCGHWHCSTGWAKTEGRSETGEDARFDPFYGDGFIAIDACTALSGRVNVLVIEDDPL